VVEEVVADQATTMADYDHPVEVVQDEEPTEEEPGMPEWIRNPCIKVIVIPWGKIICDHGRAFLIVVVVDYRR
jgi:hypothetical protein